MLLCQNGIIHWSQHAKKCQVIFDPILKNKKLKESIGKRAEFDKKIGLPRKQQGSFYETAKLWREINFWAGQKGKIVGKIRFLLGDKFDKLASKMKKLKQRTKKIGTKIKGFSVSGGFGWKGKLIRIISKGFKSAFKVFVSESFKAIAGCINAIIIITKFEQSFNNFEITDEIEATLKKLNNKVDRLKTEIETKYDAKMKEYEGLLAEMKDIGFYAKIFSGAITTIRLGIQVISCLAPPGLGCLWGLIGQLGLSLALNLLVGTQWFEQNMLKPIVKGLVDKFAKSHLMEFMNKLLSSVGLGDYVAGVGACQPTTEAKNKVGYSWFTTPRNIKILPSQYDKYRREWEAKNKSTLMKQIIEGGGSGTEADVEQLLRVIREKKITPKELKETFIKKGFDVVRGKIAPEYLTKDASNAIFTGTTSGKVKGSHYSILSSSRPPRKGTTLKIHLAGYLNGKLKIIIKNVPAKVIKRTLRKRGEEIVLTISFKLLQGVDFSPGINGGLENGRVITKEFDSSSTKRR